MATKPRRTSGTAHGAASKANDRRDLKRLYQMAWSGQLTQINGTPITFVRPYHTVGATPQEMVAVLPAPPAPPLPSAAAYPEGAI